MNAHTSYAPLNKEEGTKISRLVTTTFPTPMLMTQTLLKYIESRDLIYDV
jgi:hypothetical protein